jgi:hypothetical protein
MTDEQIHREFRDNCEHVDLEDSGVRFCGATGQTCVAGWCVKISEFRAKSEKRRNINREMWEI